MSTFDVVVIGGGPAGMMAAARAAQYGARTALIEKNKELGRKLMITGRGRCNFAHDEEDAEVLSKGYRNGGDFLLPSLKKFGTKETTAFFLRRGVVPAHERGHRIYPKEGQDASSIVNALWTALKDGGVHVLRGAEVRAFDFLGGKARRITTAREEIEAKTFIIATGGLSFPNTGSTGDGYRWARKAGHGMTPTEPALCPVKIAEHFDDHLSGLKLKNVRVTLCAGDEAVDERFGEMDFTPFGISGAIIMDMASSISERLKKSSRVTLHIDLKPALEPERLDARIGRDFEEFSGDALRFALRKMLPKDLIPEVIKMAGLEMGKPCGETTPEERLILRDTMKNFVVTPTELLGFHHAIITAGGVNTGEIDPETMASKIIPNLYFAGEVLDVDGPTGGYNLQACWSTGYAAGSAAAESLGFAVPTDDQIVKQMVAAHERRDERARSEKIKEEISEDMTIKTGPTDDREFCGWRDPRKSEERGAEDGREESSAEKTHLSYSERRGERRAVDSSRDFRRERSERPRYDRRGDSGERRSYRSDDDRPRRDLRGSSDSGEYERRPPRRADDRRPYESRYADSNRPAYRQRRESYGEERYGRSERPSYDRERAYNRDRDGYRERRGSDEYRPSDRDYGRRDSRYERKESAGRYENDRPARYGDRREHPFDRDSAPKRDFRERRDFGRDYRNSLPRDENRGYRSERPYRDDRPRRDFRDERDSGERGDERRNYRGDRPSRDGRPRRDFRREEGRRTDDRARPQNRQHSESERPRTRRFTNFEQFRGDDDEQ